MPKFSCACGKVLDLSPIPSPDQHYLVSEAALFEISDALKSDANCKLLQEFQRRSRGVLLCGECQRLYFWDEGLKEDVCYIIERSRLEVFSQLLSASPEVQMDAFKFLLARFEKPS